MNIKKTAYTLTIFLISTLLLAYSLLVAKNLEEKKEWAFLQATEYTHRYQASEKYKIIDKSDSNKYSALGISTLDSKRPMAWILLNDDKDTPIKILPQNANISLHCADIEILINHIKPDSKTVQFLRSKCH